ncbi:MAG: hypothetical protein ACUVQY_03255 [Thermoproteota archaeon]
MFFLMYPTMAKVKLEELSHAVKNVGPMLMTLIANWIIAPPLMVLLATLFLRNPEFRAEQSYWGFRLVQEWCCSGSPLHAVT